MIWTPGEAVRNVASGTTHAARYAMTLTLLLGTMTAADVLSVDQLLTHAATVRDSGSAVLVVESPGQVRGAACAALSALPQIQAAGALRAADTPVTALTLPRGPLSTYLVTDGLVELLDAESDGPSGILLSENAASALSVQTGDDLATTIGMARVRAVYSWPDDGRRVGFSYAALVPVDSDQHFDQCWVRAWPMPSELSMLLRTTVAQGEDGTGTAITLLNVAHGTSFDGSSSFTARPTRLAVWAGIGVGLMIGFIATGTRRLELAAARHVGVSARHQHLQLLFESLCWVLPGGLIIAAVSAVLTASAQPEHQATLWGIAAHTTVPGLLMALLGVQCGVFSIREHDLYRYFTHR